MDRLSLVLTFFTGPVLTGALLVPLLSLGWVGWTPILIAAAFGILLSWPAAYWISRRVKRQDPGFDHTRADPGPIPDPSAPEV